MTAFATVLAIFRAGATPVLADIDPETALLDRESVFRCISPKTKAVLLVHLYGQVRDMGEWQSFCDQQGLCLIEDCAQAHLATWKARRAGSFGRFGAFSFYPTKNLGALGDAGALVTNDLVLAQCAARLRNYGQSVRYHHPEIGLNSRLDEIHAAMLQVRLKWLPEFTQRRQEIARSYREGIKNGLIKQLCEPEELSAHVYHLYVIICEQRDALQVHLESAGIQTHCHYPVPVHHQKACRDIQRDPNGLQASERHAKTCLSLPCHPQMTAADVEKVVDSVNAFRA
jgi:dTDP-4-amino-4,6-dideoxygalactose transaminase